MKLVRDVRVRAPGKINLSLTAGPPREDGYHPLETVFQAVSLYEEVLARPTSGEISVETRGRGAERVPDDETNLAVRAAQLLRERTGVDSGAHLTITKQVPVAGGMAGGSADAAATLVACDDLWETGLSRAELGELGAELGADVPFALAGMSALGTDRGDVLTPVMSRGTYHWVLALQDWGLSTPEVFGELDALRGDAAVAEAAAGPRREGSAAGDVVAALVSADPLVLSRALHNELEEAAIGLRPELADVLVAADRAGALAAVLSGSGPTVAALALDAPHAASVAGVMRSAEVAAEVVVVTGPMPGARAVTAMTEVR